MCMVTLKKVNKQTSMIRTKASLAQKLDSDAVQVVVFDGKKKRLPKTLPPSKTGNEGEESDDSEFERVFGDGPRKKKPKKNEVTFDSARREIINFGIAGSSSSDKLDLNQQLAIKLGAKPPKRQARNYKDILEDKRKEKALDEAVNKRTIFGTSASLQYRSQKKPAPKRDGLLKRYGKVEKESKDQGGAGRKRKR